MHIQFIETTLFSREREKWLPENEFQAMEAHLLDNPEAGDLIIGTGGCRKLRWKRQGMGKSGGIRVIYYHISQRGKIYLLLAYSKNKQENLSDAQKDALRAIINQLE